MTMWISCAGDGRGVTEGWRQGVRWRPEDGHLALGRCDNPVGILHFARNLSRRLQQRAQCRRRRAALLADIPPNMGMRCTDWVGEGQG